MQAAALNLCVIAATQSFQSLHLALWSGSRSNPAPHMSIFVTQAKSGFFLGWGGRVKQHHNNKMKNSFERSCPLCKKTAITESEAEFKPAIATFLQLY